MKQSDHSCRSVWAWAVIGCGAALSPVCADEAPAPEVLNHFERHVRPLLVEHCHSCHAGAKAKGGLLLDSRESILRGGDTGPSLVVGKPEESLLIQAVKQTHAEVKMPPRNRLGEAQVAALVKWVEQGAPYPSSESGASVAASGGIDMEAGRKHWAFQPVRDPQLPSVKDEAWSSQAIDRFVLAKLEAAGLRPAPEADRRTLIRRATFDLTGLPPTVEEVAAFLADESPDAFAKVVDRLLASPRYGERWGRHWLDLARYADSNGSDENKAYANAWRYRDYVIKAFNDDKPYDLFLHEQIAGDLLPASDDVNVQYERWTATGFLVLGPKMLAEQDKAKLVMDLIDEQLDVLGQSVLGMTFGCARCHDHKFDPIRDEDYYALAGVFKSTKTMANLSHVSLWNQRPLATQAQKDAAAAHAKGVAELQKRIAQAEKELKDKSKEAQGKEEREAQLKAMRQELEELNGKAPPAIAETMAVSEDKATEVPVHIRGSHLNLAADPVPRAEPAVLSHLVKFEPIPQGQSGRLQLARWLTDPANPLTARVMVNRLWQHHFGQGLVPSSSNFGLRGETPTHPELLDHLAVQFMHGRHGGTEASRENGSQTQNSKLETRNLELETSSPWSIKAMHRMIMLSATYRMSTRHDEQAALKDPDNRLLWRMNRRRLEAEPIRDALFAVAGNLDLTMGGTLLPTKNDDYVPVTFRQGGGEMFQSPRRAVYLPVIRNALYPLFSTFDYGDAGVPIARRSSTTVAHQALFMLNSELVMDQAGVLSSDLKKTGDEAARLSLLYERLFARPPAEAERQRAMAFLDHAARLVIDEKKQDESAARDIAWQRLCHALMASGEFIYVD